MPKKFAWSFILVGFLLVFLKAGVDLCLPYRTSALLPQVFGHEYAACQVMYDWDEAARAERMRISQGLITFSSELERRVLDPQEVSYGDVLLAWQVPKILPLILEAVPQNSMSLAKICFFWVGAALVLGGIWHYLSLLVQIYQVSSGHFHKRLGDEHRPFEKLLGRDR